MKHDATLARKERERAALAEEAMRIVQAAEAHSRVLTPAEDAHVLELLARARILEEEIKRKKRHYGESTDV
jgi:hypothetical protein